MADVFISYSKARAAIAGELAGELADLGYEVWWDTSLLPTGSFGAAIDRELDEASAVIVIWSAESARSKWVYSEASHADRQEKLVNSHTVEITDPAVQIPKPFGAIHSVGVDDIRAIVRGLDALSVPRSGGIGVNVEAPESSAQILSSADDQLFAEVEATASLEAYEFYLNEFPQGAHAPLARFRIKALRETLEREAEVHQRSEQERVAMARAETEQAYQSEGRLCVDAPIIESPTGNWFLPGDGNRQYFKDHLMGPEMVVVPAGAFMMGEGSAARSVTIDAPFAVARYPTTFDEWDFAFAEDGVGHEPSDEGWGRGSRPVINVSWNDAKEYAAWLSLATGKTYRLLSEVEWEYCCRAGTTTPYSFGDTITKQQAQFSESGGSAKHTVEVGSFPANAWGLYDMHGNVWEWCEDAYDSWSRVLRGGSWLNHPEILRSADRSRNRPVIRNYLIGFRLARTL